MDERDSRLATRHIELRSRPFSRRAVWRVAEGYISRKPWRFTLSELVTLTGCVALSCVLTMQAGFPLGLCFLLTVVCFRTSIIDFTVIGALSTLLTTFFGSLGVALLIIWAATW